MGTGISVDSITAARPATRSAIFVSECFCHAPRDAWHPFPNLGSESVASFCSFPFLAERRQRFSLARAKPHQMWERTDGEHSIRSTTPQVVDLCRANWMVQKRPAPGLQTPVPTEYRMGSWAHPRIPNRNQSPLYFLHAFAFAVRLREARLPSLVDGPWKFGSEALCRQPDPKRCRSERTPRFQTRELERSEPLR